MSINYLKGDATDPIETGGNQFIVHICNNRGGWGRGFVLALSKRWPEPEAYYRRWFRDKTGFKEGRFQLGSIQVVPVREVPPIFVVNMIAQEGYGKNNQNLHQTNEPNDRPPIRYDALERCLSSVSEFSGTVHMPRIGCSLGGGSWRHVEPIIQRTLVAAGLSVYVYDVPGGKFNE